MKSTKICKLCDSEKPIVEFNVGRAQCKLCYREKVRLKAIENRKNNKEKYREIERRAYLKKVGGSLGKHICAVVRNDEGKVCSRCKEFKAWDMFTKQKGSKDGHAYFCRSCGKERKKKYLSSKQGMITENNYRIIHKEDRAKAYKKWAQKNKEKVSEYKKNNYTLEDRRRWRENYENKKSTPGSYVIWEGKKAEVLSATNGAIRISLLSNRKQVVTYKTYLKLWKNPLTY